VAGEGVQGQPEGTLNTEKVAIDSWLDGHKRKGVPRPEIAALSAWDEKGQEAPVAGFPKQRTHDSNRCGGDCDMAKHGVHGSGSDGAILKRHDNAGVTVALSKKKSHSLAHWRCPVKVACQ